MYQIIFRLVIITLLCLFCFSCTDTNLSDNTETCNKDSDCTDGYRCYKGDCRLSCHDRDCPEQLPICNDEQYCVSSTTATDGDMDQDKIDMIDKDMTSNGRQ